MRQYVQLLRVHPWAIPVIVILFAGFQSAQLIPYMTQHDVYPDYDFFIMTYVESCSMSEPRNGELGLSRAPLKWWLYCVGYQTTGYPGFFIIPFNMAVLPMTYLVASAITKDRIIGLISIVTMANLPLYKDWATSSTYSMEWAFFLLVGIYLIYRKRGTLSGVLFMVSVAAKSLTLLYFPAFLYSSVKNKRHVGIMVIVAGSALGLLMFSGNIEVIVGNSVGFYPENIEDALFRNISLLWQVIPFMLGLAAVYAGFKGKSPEGTKDVAVWIMCIILTTPVIHLFTQQLTFSYRFVVLGVMLSIFTGQVITRAANYFVKAKVAPVNH